MIHDKAHCRLESIDTIVGKMAIAVNSDAIIESLQQVYSNLILAYDAMLDGWSRALDLRDKETEGHSARVTQLSVSLAKAMGVSPADLIHVHRGALLHDVGKIGVPDRILLKPGPLTQDEWQVMHKHPVYAFEWLSGISFLREALDIPYCHHERLDGSGYPRGLMGEEIPLLARIFAVVDVWDALTHDRPYRAAWPEGKALSYIDMLAGRQLDPDVVSVFLEIAEDQTSTTRSLIAV
jgi:HD-GYP domain-containing protein (c-di-GMP phosphodiesterase class II)